MNFINKITNYHKASYPGLFVLTHEEGRLTQELIGMATDNPKLSVHVWDAQRGLQYCAGANETSHPSDTSTSTALLEYLGSRYRQENNIFILKDFHLHFDKVINIRLLRNAWNWLKSLNNMIVFVGHKFNLPGELLKEVQLVDYNLPDAEAVRERLDYIVGSVNAGRASAGKPELPLSESIIETAVEAAQGMTHYEIENAFSLGIVSAKAFNQDFVHAVFQEKIAQLKKSGLLTYMEPNVSFDNVGGMQGLKKWLLARKNGYTKEAQDYHLPMPKGILLASVPGTGNILL